MWKVWQKEPWKRVTLIAKSDWEVIIRMENISNINFSGPREKSPSLKKNIFKYLNGVIELPK